MRTSVSIESIGRQGTSSTPEVPWQVAMTRAIRSSAELRKRLRLPADPVADSADDFPTFVPLELLRRIQPEDPSDPILRQVLASRAELQQRQGFVSDPVGDLNSLAAPGVLHKYSGRALVVTHGACAVHCRYCFRREYPYVQTGARASSWRPTLEYLRATSTIEEVLLSGGDPLTLNDETLFGLIEQIESIPHVRRLRIHTRLPVAIPQRITPSTVDRLRISPLTVWTVVHCNHPQELDQSVLDSLARLIDAGIPVLNQAVLLRGVNDDSETLIQLCQKLIDHRVTPYYLNQLDRVRGASHFWVPQSKGMALMETLRKSLPGYAVPTYVVDEASRESKTRLS